VDAQLLAPLRETVLALAPDVVVVSGDLTQRARSAQFCEAQRFLSTLPGPQIVVPGNHDIPLYNVAARFLTPLVKYKRYITTDMAPLYMDGEIAVLGLNTARSLTFKDGRVNREQLELLHQRFDALPRHVTRVVVTHHPFDLPETYEEEDLVDRAEMAMSVFSQCGVDLLLAGHMHTSHSQSSAARYKLSGYAALVVQAGTATSTRGRGETNSFNVLRVEHERIEVERYSWSGSAFTSASREVFLRSGDIWQATASSPTAAPSTLSDAR